MGVASHSPQRIDKADSGTTIDKIIKSVLLKINGVIFELDNGIKSNPSIKRQNNYT